MKSSFPRISLRIASGLAVFAMASTAPAQSSGSAVTAGTAQLPFPDFGFMSSPGQYTGTVFKLSQDYPAVKPGNDKIPAFFAKLPKTLSADFGVWRDYMMAVRDYCFEGNLDIDWRVQANKVRPWYHIPWQHYGASGREGIHGLTKEAPVQSNQLAIGQGQPVSGDFYQTYAVGFFNDFGGYGIGQVWADHLKPNLAATTRPKEGFPVGTTISKLLFVDVPSEQVPSLINPMQWQGYIQATYGNPTRSTRTVSLIQMDIAVRDDRAPTGWFFGTFQYNGTLNHANRWENLIPVGIMWGNDPTITDSTYDNANPKVTKINPNLKETSINPNSKELPPTHLGWNGRLNGPVDNAMSSCMSCHMTAEVPALSPLSPLFQANPPAVGSPAWMRWFANGNCGEPFDKGAQSADFSLQLSIGVTNFLTWAAPAQSGLFAADFQTAPSPAPTPAPMLGAAPGAPMLLSGKPAAHKVFPIVRDIVAPGTEK